MSVIRFKADRSGRATPKPGRSRSAAITDEDWDKFEKDIADANSVWHD